MLDAYIIEKLKHEKEEQEQQQWQPIPLPLEEYDPRDPIERRKKEREDKEDDPRGVMIIRFQSCKNSENFTL